MWQLSAVIGLIGACVYLEVDALHIIHRHNDFEKAPVTSRPIIGILSQEPSLTIADIYPENYTSYIAASYVKFVEGGGARAVPIFIGQSEAYYRDILGHVNGLLLPGGAVWFNNTAGYGETGTILLNIATEMNRQGDYFPVWGTCLGYELIMWAAAAPREPRSSCYSTNVSLALSFKPDYASSRMFKNAPADIINILATKNVTSNFHTLCITEATLAELGMDPDWQVMSVNTDADGIVFISTIEARTMPFYGLQFHPEKNTYEFKANKNIPHSKEAILVTQYFADFLVSEARKNSHSFSSSAEEQAALIYNYHATYTGDRLSFAQCYFFY